MRLLACAIFIFFASCGNRSSPNVHELPPTKQKQKITLLQKKLLLAEREQEKLQTHIEKLSEEVRETQIAYIRKQIDLYEEQLRKASKEPEDINSTELFLAEREQLHRMIQGGESSFEAQVVLDRILQLITELSDARE